MQFLCFASRSNTIMIHPHHHQVQRRNSRKQCLAYPPWLSDLQMVSIEIWLENKLPGLPKNTGSSYIARGYYGRPWQGPITIILLQSMLIHIFDAEMQVLRALVTEVTGRHKWRRLDAAYLISSWGSFRLIKRSAFPRGNKFGIFLYFA